MAASKQEVYFIAIRMQVGAIRRELPVIGLCDQGRDTVLEALELVEAQVREWAAETMVTVQQLQEALAALMSPYFEHIDDAPAEDSIPIFAGRERWQVWQRRR